MLARFVLAALAVFISLLYPGSAHASVSSNVCSRFSGEYTSKYLDKVGGVVASRLPAHYFSLIRGIRIAPSTDPSLLGPAVRDGASLSIEAPATYLQDQCWLIVVQDYLEKNPDAAIRLRAELAKCVAARTPIMSCFRDAAPALIERAGDQSSMGDKAPLSALPESYVMDAADFLIAHEISHIITRLTKSKSQILNLDEEYEADLFAQIVIASQRPIHPGVLMSLATTSILSDYRQAPPTHDQDLCRLARVSLILSLTVRPSLDVTMVRLGSLISLSDSANIVKQSLELAHPFLIHGSALGECKLEPPAVVVRFVDDLNYLQSRYRQLDGKGDEDMIPALSSILRHEYRSDFGEMIGISTVTSMFFVLDGSKFISSSVPWPKTTGKESAAYMKLMADIWNLTDEKLERSKVRLAELSGLILLRALYDITNLVRDHSAGEAFQSFMTKFELAEGLFDGSPSSRSLEIGVSGKALGDNPNFGDEFFLSAKMTYLSALFATDKCDRAAEYAARLGKEWGVDVTVMARGAEPEICKKFKDATWAFARKSGWQN